MTTKQATKAQAEAVVAELCRVVDIERWGYEPPTIMVDTWEDGRTVFVFYGPPGWTWIFPDGGPLGYGGTVTMPKAELPTGVWVEPYSECVVSVWQEV